MKPDAQLPIYQTKVSTIPSYRFPERPGVLAPGLRPGSITGHGDVPMTVQALKAGAVEFLTKPFKDDVLLDAIRDAIDHSRDALRVVWDHPASAAALP